MDNNCAVCGQHFNIMSCCDECENIVCPNHIVMIGSDGVCTNCAGSHQPRENLNNNNRDSWMVETMRQTNTRMDAIEERITSIQSDLTAILEALTSKNSRD